MSETASATIAAIQVNPTTWQYSITLHDTGSTTIGTFWFAWDDVPDQNFLTSRPISVSSPTGWSDFITQGSKLGFTAGFGIQWTASAPAADLMAGNSLTFSFTSTDTPASVFGTSSIDPTFQTTSSFVYTTTPFSDAGFNISGIAPACFRAGTRIRTSRGEVAVEALREGDQVLTVDGTYRPVRWLGRRDLDCRRHKAPEQVWPVRVARDAFAQGVPLGDLYLSPDHAVFVDRVLVPVKYLMNGATIVQVPMDEVVYHHLALDRHDVLLAEGMPAESYLDTGGRGMFENGDGPVALHPDFAVRVWEAEGYAPLVVAGALLAPIRQRLDGRAALSVPRGREAAGEPSVKAIA